jgi:hypothetical protein
MLEEQDHLLLKPKRKELLEKQQENQKVQKSDYSKFCSLVQAVEAT